MDSYNGVNSDNGVDLKNVVGFDNGVERRGGSSLEVISSVKVAILAL